MKTVQDKDGNIIKVPFVTPCHAGKNGALPIMLDAVVDANIFTEMAEKEVKYAAEAPERALQSTIDARNKERGSWQEQMHYLIKNGLDALQQRDNDIELRHPKP